MGAVILVFFLCFIPTVIYTAVLWWLDRYEKEPLILLFLAFLWGAIPAVIISIILELLFEVPILALRSPQMVSELLSASVSAPLVEESAKAGALIIMVLVLWIFKYGEIDGPLDGMIYGGIAGFGFAAVENFLYLLGAYSAGGPGGAIFLGLLRAGLFGLNHAMFTGFTGLGIALALDSRQVWKKFLFPLVGFAIAVGAHAFHNAFSTFWGYAGNDIPLLLAVLSDWGGVLMLLAMAVWAIFQEKKRIQSYIQGHVQAGHLSANTLSLLISPRKRWFLRAKALLTGNVQRWWYLGRYYQLVTESAFAWSRWTRGNQGAKTQLDALEARTQEVQLRLVQS